VPTNQTSAPAAPALAVGQVSRAPSASAPAAWAGARLIWTDGWMPTALTGGGLALPWRLALIHG
jgi:hypothetical protein